MDLQPLILAVPETAAATERYLVLTSPAAARDALGVDAAGLDFGQYLLLAAFRGLQRSGGHAVRLLGAEQQGDTVEVRVQHVTPPVGAITLTALTHPQALALLPKAALVQRGKLSFVFRETQGRRLAVVQAEVD